MAHFVVLKSGDLGKGPFVHGCSWRSVPRLALDRVGLEFFAAITEVEFGLDPVFLKIGLRKGLDASGEGLVAQDDDRTAASPGQLGCFEGNVEAVFHILGCEDDAGAVAM